MLAMSRMKNATAVNRYTDHSVLLGSSSLRRFDRR
jgi:hypothetical protein